MGKIVKFCSSCDEGFAEKFGFCPNCGAALQAFEMNPLAAAPSAAEVAEPVAAVPVVEAVAAAPVEEAFEVNEPILEIEEAMAIEAAPIEELDEIETVYTAPVEEVAEVEMAYTAPAEEVIEIEEPLAEPIRNAADTSVNGDFLSIIPATATAAPFIVTKTLNADGPRVPLKVTPIKDEEFRVTVIEENKNSGTRNGLLAGATGFMVFALIAGLVVNLFSKDLEVGSIDNDTFLASLIDDVPMDIQEEIDKKNKDEGGGGGGGGREEDETTQGDLADQTKNPERPPQAIPRLENPSLVLPKASTEGNKTFEKKFDRFGDPDGRFSNWNNGTGTGGGQGTGTGTGQGSGRGTGAGSGTGSGYGSGIGSGNGGGTGAGDGDGGPPPPVVPRGVTSPFKILSKPRPGYTDAARQNNIQGTVILRVTFMANGSIGSISAIKGLPNGLTEQAIAAARRINFEPQKSNGIGQTVTKQVEYTFSIY